MDLRTVNKYLEMTEEAFEQTLGQAITRSKIVSPYETFVKDKLVQYPETPTSQLHDWFVRQTHNIPVVKASREYFTVPELPYGEQAQVNSRLD